MVTRLCYLPQVQYVPRQWSAKQLHQCFRANLIRLQLPRYLTHHGHSLSTRMTQYSCQLAQEVGLAHEFGQYNSG